MPPNYNQSNTNYSQYGGYGVSPDQSRRQKILVGVMVASISLAAIIGFFAIINRNDGLGAELAKSAAIHQELARVAELSADTRQASASTKQLAAVTKLVASSNVASLKLLAAENIKEPISKQELAGQKDPSIDEQIEEASSLNNVDSVINDNLQTLIKAANAQLSRTFDASKNDKINQELSLQFLANEDLLKSF